MNYFIFTLEKTLPQKCLENDALLETVLLKKEFKKSVFFDFVIIASIDRYDSPFSSKYYKELEKFWDCGME